MCAADGICDCRPSVPAAVQGHRQVNDAVAYMNSPFGTRHQADEGGPLQFTGGGRRRERLHGAVLVGQDR
jgi:hypothetical protein